MRLKTRVARAGAIEWAARGACQRATLSLPLQRMEFSWTARLGTVHPVLEWGQALQPQMIWSTNTNNFNKQKLSFNMIKMQAKAQPNMFANSRCRSSGAERTNWMVPDLSASFAAAFPCHQLPHLRQLRHPQWSCHRTWLVSLPLCTSRPQTMMKGPQIRSRSPLSNPGTLTSFSPAKSSPAARLTSSACAWLGWYLFCSVVSFL